MPGSVQLNIDIPIRSVSMIDEAAKKSISAHDDHAVQQRIKQIEQQYASLCGTLSEIAGALKNTYQEIVDSQAEHIIRLSVGIAEKILLKEISAGNYDIKKIVAHALKAAPSQQDVVVRVNPEDLRLLDEKSSKQDAQLPTNIQLVADPAVGKAQCIIETDKGMIECCIDEHLEQIRKSLEEAA
jgi:flagellar assembly protein FliH